MVKANELMIGDYIFRPSCYDKVVEIRTNGIIGTDSLRGLIGFNQLDPIPITPEILEKNGFRLEEENDLHKKYIALDKLCIIVFYFYKETIYGVSTLLDCERDFVGGLDRIHKCNLLYVHELQQAMRLCKINRNIEL